jgi:hypothetical protein
MPRWLSLAQAVNRIGVANKIEDLRKWYADALPTLREVGDTDEIERRFAEIERRFGDIEGLQRLRLQSRLVDWLSKGDLTAEGQFMDIGGKSSPDRAPIPCGWWLRWLSDGIKAVPRTGKPYEVPDLTIIDWQNSAVRWTDQAGRMVAFHAIVVIEDEIEKLLKPETAGPSLRPAPETEIHKALKAVYDAAAEKHGEKPPNKIEIVPRVQDHLRSWGLKASGRQIQKIADDPQHAMRRLDRGMRFRGKSSC